jgi:hypothetical protein
MANAASSRGAQRLGDPWVQAWQATMDCFAALAMTGLDFMDGFARSQLLRGLAKTEIGFL